MAKNAMKTGTSGFDPNKVPKYVSRIENLQADIDKIKAVAADECAPLYEDIAKIKAEAHDNDNIPRKVLNAFVQYRNLKGRVAAVRTKLSDDQKEHFDQMEFAFEKSKAKSEPTGRRDAGEGSENASLN